MVGTEVEKGKMKLLLTCILLLTFASCGWGVQKESRTFYLTKEELKKLNSGKSVYRWYGEGKPYGEGNQFMDEIRSPEKLEKCPNCDGKGKL